MPNPSDKDFSQLFIVGAWMAGGGLVLSGVFYTISGFFGNRGAIGVFASLGLLCVLVFAAGIVLMGLPFLTGAKHSVPTSGKVYRYADTKVIARYAMNPAGEMLFDESYIDMDDPETRFFVRLQPPNQNTHEYRCNVPIWYQCAEGMVGIAYIQGDWVGQFTPTGNARSAPTVQ